MGAPARRPGVPSALRQRRPHTGRKGRLAAPQRTPLRSPKGFQRALHRVPGDSPQPVNSSPPRSPQNPDGLLPGSPQGFHRVPQNAPKGSDIAPSALPQGSLRAPDTALTLLPAAEGREGGQLDVPRRALGSRAAKRVALG